MGMLPGNPPGGSPPTHLSHHMKQSIPLPLRISLLTAPLAVVTAQADTWTWNGTSNGLSWSASTYWNAPVGAGTVYPTGAGAVADFGQVTVGNARTVYADLNVTVGSILMNSPYGWSIIREPEGISTITIDNLGAGGLISLSGGGGAYNQSSTLGNTSTTKYIRLSLADDLTIRTNTGPAATYTIHTPIVGTGNLVIETNSAGSTVFSTASSLNAVGAVTNAGTGTGTVTVGSVIGANVTGVTQNSATSKLVLSGANLYSGPTTVMAGILELGASERLADSSRLVLDGGTFATRGFSETLGELSLLDDSVIDLGSGSSALVFADSHTQLWNASVSLSIINYTAGVNSIRFGTNDDGLTLAQLGQITINGESVGIDDNGYLTLVSIPEPSTAGLMAGMLGLGLAASGRKRR